jgi:hypothetical protein
MSHFVALIRPSFGAEDWKPLELVALAEAAEMLGLSKSSGLRPSQVPYTTHPVPGAGRRTLVRGHLAALGDRALRTAGGAPAVSLYNLWTFRAGGCGGVAAAVPQKRMGRSASRHARLKSSRRPDSSKSTRLAVSGQCATATAAGSPAAAPKETGPGR